MFTPCLELFLYHLEFRTARTTYFSGQGLTAKHWRERQRAELFSWLSEGKALSEMATLQERIPETIRLQRRRWELY